MKIIDYTEVKLQGTAVALGKFQGLHKGHMLLIHKIAEMAKEQIVAFIGLGARAGGDAAAVEPIVEQRRIGARRFERRAADPPERARNRGAVGCGAFWHHNVMKGADGYGPILHELAVCFAACRKADERETAGGKFCCH